MKTIVPLSLAVGLFGAGASGAEQPTAFGLLDGTIGRPELVPVPRPDRALSKPPAVEVAPVPRAPSRGAPLSAISLDSLRATRERPVFSETRRPPVVAVVEPVHMVEPAPEPVPVEPESPKLTLVGTVVGPAERGVAIFLNSAAHHIVRLRIGEADSGWTLRTVEPKTTTLEKDSHEVTLSLPPPDALSAPGGVGSPPDGMDAFLEPPGGTPGSPGGTPGGYKVPRGGLGPRGMPIPFPSRLPGPVRTPQGKPLNHEF